MNDTTLPTSKIVSITNFRGKDIYVVEHKGEQYLPLKILTDSIGLDWKGVKKSVSNPDYMVLYSIQMLNPPVLEGLAGNSTRESGTYFIRMDKVQIYIARLNIQKIRAKGNHEAADYLLTLLKEWASVLHRYELGETVSKAQESGALRELKQPYDLQKIASNQAEKHTLSALIKSRLAALGGHVEDYVDSQRALNL